MSRLPGHELLWEGAAYVRRGTQFVTGPERGTRGVGYGKCSCGALSPELASGNQRKQWHRDHKNEIRTSQQEQK